MPTRVLPIFTLLLALTAGSAQAQDPAVERADAARHAYEAAEAGVGLGTSTPEEVYQWSRRWLESVKTADAAQATTAVADHLARMEALQIKVRGLTASGMMPAAAEAACTYYVAEARVWEMGAGVRH